MNGRDTYPLKAGNLSLLLENGFVRYIRIGHEEIIRMVYYAIRDENWKTIDHTIHNFQLNDLGNAFEVKYEAVSSHPDIHYKWQCIIAGKENEVTFEIKGKAFSDFLRNRIGLCILHPISECKGKSVKIGHSDGSFEWAVFPERISPHQPFKDIVSMEWNVGSASASVELEGEIFENEDQRNWLDASYKTYGTPLGLPYPVRVTSGDEVHQTFRFRLANADAHLVEDVPMTLHSKEVVLTPPRLGLAANEEQLDPEMVARLKQLELDHLRVDVRIHETDWVEQLRLPLNQARLLELPVELVIYIVNDYIPEAFSTIPWNEYQLNTILLIDDENSVIEVEKANKLKTQLEKYFKDVPIGIGTDFYFTQLNRNRPGENNFDFLAFSTNPQVHAFDNRSLIETASTFSDIVETVSTFSDGLPVHITPVTLKPRSNPDATSQETPAKLKERQMDPRQKDLITAQWFLAAYKSLAMAGAQQVTFFQTVGEGGVIMDNRLSPFSLFKVRKKETYPVFEAIRMVTSRKGFSFMDSISSHPLIFEGLLMKGQNGETDIILINFTQKLITIHYEDQVFDLDAGAVKIESIKS